jgi:hypothetical protein
MRPFVTAFAALIVLVAATWSVQERLSALQLLTLPKETSRAQATITQLELPQGAKPASAAARARLTLAYKVDGKDYGRVMLLKLNQLAYKEGQALPILYVKRAPEVMVLEDDFGSLKEDIRGLQTLLMVLGIAAFLVPLGLAGRARKKFKAALRAKLNSGTQ